MALRPSDEEAVQSLINHEVGHDVEDPEEGDTEGKLTPMTDDEINDGVRFLIDEAVDFSESELSHARIVAQRYFNGETDLASEPGRSSIVVTRVRDAVLHLMPSIMRIFLQGEDVVEFRGTGAEDINLAEQATQLCNDIFWNKNKGYEALYEAAQDSLTKKVGIMKIWWDDTPKRITDVNEEMSVEEYEQLLTEPDVEITEESDNEDGTMYVVSVREIEGGELKFMTVPPEDFHTNRQARSKEDAVLMVHRENKTISDMIEMGFTYDEVKDATYEDNSTTDQEDDYRRGYVARNRDEAEIPQDPVSRQILVTDSYVHIDADGDGIAELRHFITVGAYHKVILDEPADCFPFAIFYSEIEPHAFYPRCLADMNLQDQDSASSLMRGVLDNVQLSNSPQREVDETATNLEDTMNSEIGAIIRSRRIGSVKDLAVPFIGGQTLPVMQYLDKIHESRSGVTQLSAGLDPDVLQSTTPGAVDATVSASQARAELIARNLASSGMCDLFRTMLKIVIKNSTGQTQVAVGEQFKTMQPRLWHDQLNMRVNVGLGTGQPQQKVAALQGVAQKQEQIIQTYGPENPYSGWTELRHTYVEILDLVGYQDVAKFFPEPDPQKIAAWQKQQEQQQQKSPAEMQMETLMKVEEMKAQVSAKEAEAKVQADMQKAAVATAADMSKARMSDDRMRDKDAMDYQVDVAEVSGKYNIAVNDAAVKAETERQRNYEQFRATPNVGGRPGSNGQAGATNSQ